MSASRTKKSILVVDDEPFVSEALRMILTFEGYEVSLAHSGEEALALFEPGKFDLVITDLLMPVMRGDALAEQIKSRDPDQPILMVTAHAELLKTSNTRPQGVDGILSKPFLVNSLRDAVATAMH